MMDVTKTIGDGRTLFEDVSLSAYEGAKIGVLGINGSGKSSLLKIIAGVDTEYDGELKLMKGFTVGYLAQEPTLDPEKDVKGNILEGVAEKKAILDEYLELSEKIENKDGSLSPEELEKMKSRHAELGQTVDNQKLMDLNRKIERAIDALRCPPGESSVVNLSGGERRRVALARLLISQPDILLLDEPTNHLDAESVAWLERYLKDFKGTVLAITHDRYFLDNVASWILEIDRGQAIPFKGNYTKWLEEKQKRLELEAKRDAIRSKALDKELEWIKQSPKARQAKSKSRIYAYERMLQESTKAKHPGAGAIVIKPGPRLGDVVVEAENISKTLGDKLLFKDFSFKIPPGAIVGVVGANGSGKTTLFNIIAGADEPDEGDVRIGKTVVMAHVAQVREEQLDPDNTIYEEVSEGMDEISFGSVTLNTRAYLAAFNFKGPSQNKLVESLSGGERNRVQLAKMLKRGVNLILLDEPTNDLDVEVLRSLETALSDFPGSAVVISHDRWFLDRICTHIIAFEGDSNVEFYSGNYSEYEQYKQRKLGDKYTGPKRIKFRKLETV